MSTEERARILRMVAEGKVTAEEAAGLLEAIETPRSDGPRTPPPPPIRPGRVGDMPPPPGWSSGVSRRQLVIRVEADGASKVNLRIPLALARTAGRFIPRQAQKHLDAYDIDLQQLVEDLGQSLGEGPIIEIEDEADRVYIGVE